MRYGLNCTLQLDDYIINIIIPCMFDSYDEAKNINIRFIYDGKNIKYELKNREYSILSKEWWMYRISKKKYSSKNKCLVDISDFKPLNIRLKDLPNTKNTFQYLSYSVWCNEN